VYAGLRPLLAGESDETSKLSREHVVRRPRPGLVVIAGGKFTTYRVMARDAVDAVVEALDMPVAASCTERVALVGAEGIVALWNQRHDLARDAGLDVEQIERLLHRYGSLVLEVLALVRDNPTLRERLEGGEDHLRAEVVYAVTHEGARHLGDVLARRTRLTIETRDRGTIAANDVAQLMAAPLRWGAERVSREVATHRALVAAEREAERRLNDRSAMEALLGVPDPVPFSRVDE
jgi:glycerol-3-phosphate dehydrogenase